MTLDDALIKQVEVDYLLDLIKELRSQRIDLPKGREITREFLTLLPFTSLDDMRNKVKTFSEKYKDFSRAYINLQAKEEQEKKTAVLDKMREHLKNKNIDEAINIAKTVS